MFHIPSMTERLRGPLLHIAVCLVLVSTQLSVAQHKVDLDCADMACPDCLVSGEKYIAPEAPEPSYDRKNLPPRITKIRPLNTRAATPCQPIRAPPDNS